MVFVPVDRACDRGSKIVETRLLPFAIAVNLLTLASKPSAHVFGARHQHGGPAHAWAASRFTAGGVGSGRLLCCAGRLQLSIARSTVEGA